MTIHSVVNLWADVPTHSSSVNENDGFTRKYPSALYIHDTGSTGLARTLGHDELHSLCGDGNQAMFGSCVASAGTKLDVLLDPDMQANPGLSFDVYLRKVDFYNQTVASDFSSFLKVHSEPYKYTANLSSDSSEPSRAAMITGQIVFLLDGGMSTAKVEVLPYFASVMPILGQTRLGVETAIYAEGLDNETSIVLRCAPPPL
jgi:hypothetical protein